MALALPPAAGVGCSYSADGLGATVVGDAGSTGGGGGRGGAPGGSGGIAPLTGGAGGRGGTGGLAGMGGVAGGGTGGTGGATWPPEDLIIGVGLGGQRVWSKDGETWNAQQDERTNNFTKNALYDLHFAQDVVVAVGGGCATEGCQGRIVRFDGSTWQPVAVPNVGVLRGVTFGGDRWVAVGDDGPALYSADGKTWTPYAQNAKAAAGRLRRVAFGVLAGVPTFVAVGENLERLRSVDGGVTWTSLRRGPKINDAELAFNDVAIGGGRVIAVGDAGIRQASSDGDVWDLYAQTGNRIHSIVFVGGEFLAYADNSLGWHSQNGGLKWDLVTIVNGPTTSVAVGNVAGEETFVGSNGPDRLLGSTKFAFTPAAGPTPNSNALLRFLFAGQTNR